MNTNNIRMHFFKDIREERIDMNKIFSFFNDIGCVYTENEKHVSFRYLNENLDNKATFVITKYNVIDEIYRLNSKYLNLNTFIEFSSTLSNYFLEEILDVIEKFCEYFDLCYYMSLNEDVKIFNKLQVFTKLSSYRQDIYSEDELSLNSTKFSMPTEQINEICEYQENYKSLKEHLDNKKVDVNPYIVMIEKETAKVKRSILWDVNNPAVFPKNLDYVHIIEESDGEPYVVKYDYIYSKVSRYLAVLPNFIDGTLALKPSGYLRKAMKIKKKFKEVAIPSEKFWVIRIKDLIDEKL